MNNFQGWKNVVEKVPQIILQFLVGVFMCRIRPQECNKGSLLSGNQVHGLNLEIAYLQGPYLA
jgi:hypothetical protein